MSSVVQHTGVRLVRTTAGDVYSVRDPGEGLVLHNTLGPAFRSVRGECTYYVNGAKHRNMQEGPAVLRHTGDKRDDEFWSEGVRYVLDEETDTFLVWGTLIE
jgi:hypothetical protein